MSLSACLPLDLQGSSITITAIAAGLSGAAVYQVEAAGRGTFVLKIASEDAPPAGETTYLVTLQADVYAAGAAQHGTQTVCPP
jgi:hypothetical protein